MRILVYAILLIVLAGCQNNTLKTTAEQLEGRWKSLYDDSKVIEFKKSTYSEIVQDTCIAQYAYDTYNECYDNHGKTDIFGQYIWLEISDDIMYCYKIENIDEGILAVTDMRSGHILEYQKQNNK